MNRFRNKKRTKDDTAATPRASQESDSPAPFRLFGKGKKSQEEELKKPIDLENALPPSDDFRTSLLMTGLSARFSMLREQDDPNTKIGKASDDSVLFPKRASRMDLGFGAGVGLSDIAEVESIRKDVPFARMDRMESFHSDGNIAAGSIMDRAKPGEGNNLFGGRQKIYKIAAGNASSRTMDGGMSHRALYDDDVALSSFQKWRQTEKAKMSFDDDGDLLQSTSSLDLARADSPPPAGYNRNRETNSTTSSTPSLGRNSTAATSVMSQPTSSVKDWPSATTAASSVVGTSYPERSMTRTKRLYETGLNHDLQEQQSSALSRMDTLSRQRGLGNRTPDLLQSGPSPTSGIFAERFGERRVLAMGSAPNLRSMSPPTAGSPVTPMDLGIRTQELKSAVGGAPPLSPPMSEGEEHSILPNDRGKATAMGMFQKPLHSYDESRYAQRQLQLQQGRETPTSRFRTESNASQTTGRSRSSSSAQRQPMERVEPVIQVEPTLKEEEAGFIYFNDRAETKQRSPIATRRPADRNHPAFRDSALPTPLSLGSRESVEPSPGSDQPSTVTVPTDHLTVPQDSPTLPSSAGLSGMVRAHLRTDSNTSSIYGVAPHTSAFASRFPLDPYDTSALADFGATSSLWDVSSPDWQSPTFPAFNDQAANDKMEPEESKEQERKREQPGPASAPPSVPVPAPVSKENLSTESAESKAGFAAKAEKEHDEFANQLANAQRRVRERLTSYVESDRDSRSLSRSLSPHSFERTREPSIPRSNALGILRSKTSKGSLNDRPNRENSQHAKAIKMLGLATSTISSAPSPNKASFDEKEPESLVKEEREKPDLSRAETAPAQASPPEQSKPDESMHAGLRAFRQARKELQKLKDMESQRSPTSNSTPVMPGPLPGAAAMVGPPASRTAASCEPTPATRSLSRERRPPPGTYQRTPSEEHQASGGPGRTASRPQSRPERDRSGSEASNGERSKRPARLRTASSPYEERGPAPSPHGPPSSRPAMMSSPGLPGTNIRRSPHMPPQPYPSAGGPQPLDRAASSGNLAVQYRRRGLDSGQPSPVSPMAPIPSPSLPVSQSTPTFGPPPRRPSAPLVTSPGAESAPVNRLDESMKRVVNKKDISEPTFVSSTSRVPTVALPETSEGRLRSGSRSRSGSILGAAASAPNLQAYANINAPPVPPFNPKRRNMIGSIMSRKGEEEMTASSPHLPLPPLPIPSNADGHSAFSVSDDEDLPVQRRRLKMTVSEANGINARARFNRGHSPPSMAAPTGIPSGVHNSALPGGMI